MYTIVTGFFNIGRKVEDPMNKYENYETCYQLAVESLESGKAYKCLQTLIT